MTQNERVGLPIWKKVIIIIVTLIVLAIQTGLFVMTFQFEFHRHYQALYFLIEISAFFLVLNIIHRNIPISYKFTWAILILSLPLPFILLYFLNRASRIIPKKQAEKISKKLKENLIENNLAKEIEKKHSKTAKIVNVIRSETKYPVYKNTKFTFLNDGLIKYNDLINELKQAKKYIFIESFIVAEGYFLDNLLEILKTKANEGVEIKILYDDLGSKRVLSPKKIKEITSIPNCEITNYNPIGLIINPVFNYRDHRKIIVIDGKIAYTGGDNIADEYIHKKERYGYWRDNCGKFEGDAVATFVGMFLEMWYMSTKKELKINQYLNNTNIINDGSFIIPFGDGPINKTDPAYDLFKLLISSSNKTLYISTPYLIVDDSMLDALCLSAKSGVDVRILMPGKPDKKSAFYLARYHYAKLIKSGVKIYEYKKGFNHAKNIIVDNEYAFIGTINMDYRSLFLHYECGALVMHDKEINIINEDFLNACNESDLITYEEIQKRPWWQKIIAYLLYIISPMF